MSAPLKFYADLAFTQSSIAGAKKQLSSAFSSANLPIGAVKSFDGALGKISTRATEFQKSMDAATARVFAFGAAVGVINAISQSFKALVLATVDVEKRLTLIQSIFGKSSSSLTKFREDIFNVAKNTGQSFAVVADAATELARQGLSAEETTKRLSDGLILTRISGLASTDAIKTLTSAINGFSDAGLNSSQVINKLIAVDNNFAISAKDLSEALSRVGSTAQDAGVSLDELLGLVTAVQQKTQRGGAVIGNAFKTIFAKISNFEVIEELKSLGVQIDSSQSGVQKLFAIAKGLEETSDPSIAARIKQLTGNIYQLNVVSAALKDISQDQSIFAEATERASKASNEAYIQNDKLGKTTAASFAALVAGVTDLSAKIGEITLQPIFKAALGIANNFVEFLNVQFDPEKGNKLFQTFFAGIGNFLAGPGLVAVGLAFGRILQLVAKFAKEGLAELLTLSDVSRKNVNLQKDLNILLDQDEKLRRLILSDATTMAQKEQLLFKAISDGNIALAQRQAIMKSLANSALAAGVANFNPKKGFVNSRGRAGAVPNFAREYPGLREAILREITGTGVKPNQVRVNQHSKFATPKNPSGIVVTNTRDEPRGVADIPNYADLSKTSLGKTLRIPKTDFASLQKSLKDVQLGFKGTGEVLSQFEPIVKKARGNLTSLRTLVDNAVNPKKAKIGRDIQAQRLSRTKYNQYLSQVAQQRISGLQTQVQSGAAQIRKTGFVQTAPPPPSRLALASNRLVSGGQAVGSGLSTAGFAAAIATPFVTSRLDENKSKELKIPEITKNLEKLESLLAKEKAKENRDENLIKDYENQIDKTTSSLEQANSQLKDFTGKTQKAAIAFTTAAFVLPQLLSTGGVAAKFGFAGIAAAIGVAIGTALNKYAIDPLIEKLFVEPSQELADKFNKVALADYADNAAERIKKLGLTAQTVSETLNTSFTAIRKTAGVTGNRANPAGRLFSEFGSSGTTGLLERAAGLKGLAQEFLPENLREKESEKARRESQVEIAKIENQLRNVFGEMGQSIGSFSDETEIAKKKVAKLEEAFLESFGDKNFKTNKESRSFLERNLKIFSQQDSKGDGYNAVQAARANAVLEARKGLSSGTEFQDKLRKAQGTIGSEESLFNLFKTLKGTQDGKVESSLIASITSLAQTLDAQKGDGSSTVSKLVEAELEAIRKAKNEELIARKKDELSFLQKQKEIYEKHVERLRGVFGSNVESLGKENFGGKSPFATKSITGQLQQTKSLLGGFGLNENEVADLTSKFVTDKGLSFDEIFKTDSFTDKYKSIFQSAYKDNNFFSDQFRKSAQEIKGEDFLKKFERQDFAGARFNAPKGVFDFVKLVESGNFDQETLANSFAGASSSIRRLESARTSGSLSQDQSNKLDSLIASFATYIAELGKRGEIFSVQNESQVAKGIEERGNRLAKGINFEADSTLTAAIKSIENVSLSLVTSTEVVKQSILSSGDGIAKSLQEASAKIQAALSSINTTNALNGRIPSPTSAASNQK